MIRKRSELDTTHPPGQIVAPVGAPLPPDSKLYKPVHGGYPVDTEEMFAPTQPTMSIHSRVRRILKK